MKTCFKCGRKLPRSEFYRHPQMTDGLLGKCKQCTRADVQESRAKRREYYQEYDRLRYRKNRADRMAIIESAIEKHPERHQARVHVHNAIRDRRLIKPTRCEGCAQEAKLHGHHEDYCKRLEVRWLCSSCHGKVHRIDQERRVG